MVTRRGGWGRDSQGVWDGYGHTAVFNMENQQGPAVQPRELCSMLCNNLMVTRGGGWGREASLKITNAEALPLRLRFNSHFPIVSLDIRIY